MGDEDRDGAGTGAGRRRGSMPGLLRLVAMALAAVAVVKELRMPPERRTWHGTVAGVVPYEFRRPTLARVRERLWSPQGALIQPHVFGVGWTVNLGRLVTLLRRRFGRSG